MTTLSQGTSSEASSANIAQGVWPPLTAKWKRPLAATAARARPATNAAPAAATAPGSASDSSSWCMPGLLLLLSEAAEFAAHRREDLVGELPGPPGLEPLVHRGRDDRGRNPLVHGGEHPPPAFAGVRDPPGEVVELVSRHIGFSLAFGSFQRPVVPDERVGR